MYHQEINFTAEEVIIYLRKSRADDPTLTVEEVLQKHESILDEWTEKHLGARVPEYNKYREVVSGETIKERPEINAVLRLVESPKYKAVAVVEPQRLTRGDLEDIGRMMKLLKHTNTYVITTNYIYDLRNEYDWDALERELKRGNDYLEYTKKILNRGKLLAVSQGQYIGNYPPFGYDKVQYEEGKTKCKTLKPNDDADTVRMIFDLYVNKDYSPQRICDYLNDLNIKSPRKEFWTTGTMKDILANIHYIGKVKWNWRKTVTIVEDGELLKTRPRIGEYLIFDGKHPAIVDEALFNAAQEKKGKNPRHTIKNKVANPFASLLYCECGSAMSYRPYPFARHRLICLNKRQCKSGSCIFEDFVEEICKVLEECIADFELRLKNDEGGSIKLHGKLIKNLEKRLEALNKKELAQWEAQADPDSESRMPPEIFKQLNAKLLKEKEEITQALCTAKDSMPNPVDYEEKLCRFRDALEALRNPAVNAQEKNRLLKACIERITYTREKPQRVESQKVRYYDKEQKKTRYKSPLKTGGNWSAPEIHLDFTLRT